MYSKGKNRNVKILLVDDKKANLISLEELLLEENSEVEFIKASSGQDALKASLNENIALILLDVQMPDMDGYEVARLLKGNSKTKNIPIIFVTASQQDVPSIIQGYETGAIDYIFKPLNPSITKAKVKSFVRMYLQQREVEQLTYLVNNSLDLMCILEVKTLKICGLNPAWHKTLGFNLEDLDGNYFYNFLNPDHKEELLQKLEGTTELKHFETSITTKNNEVKFFVWSFIQKEGIWYCNGKEFTERKCAENKLEEAQQSLMLLNSDLEERVKRRTEDINKKNKELKRINADLDNFIYTASHDLKAPISNIEGLVHALDDPCYKDKESAHVIQLINESIERFKKVINELTDVAKAQSEVMSDIELISIENMTDAVKEDIGDLIEKNNASFEEDFSEVSEVKFSKKNFRSILYNLISNAVKYCSPKRKPVVKIKTKKVTNGILLTVEDNGLGIKEEDKEKVFSMFKRLHTHVEGTGIGMSLVKRIVDNVGGKIEIESAIDQGTKFKVFLKAY
jgi:signal transduction histidine kinase/CheY-like chemotaxis protein